MSEVVENEDIELPKGWVMAQLADLVINPKNDIVDGPFGSNLKASEYTETGVPIVRLQNIKRNYFLDKNIKCVTTEKAEQLSRHSFKPGDLLITKLGAPLGVACIAPHGFAEGIIVADLVRARLPEDQVDTKYITYLINSPAVIQEFKENTKGTTRPRVNLKFMRSLMLPIAPYKQQKRIVAKIEELFSHIDAGIEALKKAKQLLKQYRQSVLKAAVTGELTKDLPCRQAGWHDKSFRNISDKRVPEKSNAYFAYVLECDDGSLYKGFSKDLYARINQHLEGRGAKWTKEHKPVALIHFEEFSSEKEAVEREKYFKSGSGREWINELRNQQKQKHETAQQLFECILKERRQKWEEQKLEQFKAKGKMPKDDKWKEKYKEPDLGADRFFGELPEEWQVATIDHLAWEVRYGSSSKTSEDDKGVPVLRMGNIIDGKLDYSNLKYLPVDHDEFPDLLLVDGDLLFNRTNSAELVGKTAVFRDTGKQTSLASYLIRVRALSGIEPDFVAFFINSSCGRSWIKSCVSQNVGQANVNGTKLKALILPLPSHEEQKEIVNCVEEKIQSSDRLLVEIYLQLLKAEKNKQSILASAFSGVLLEYREVVA